jgi:hypothetical protein
LALSRAPQTVPQSGRCTLDEMRPDLSDVSASARIGRYAQMLAVVRLIGILDPIAAGGLVGDHVAGSRKGEAVSLVKVLIVMVVSGALSGCGALASLSEDPTTPTASLGPAPARVVASSFPTPPGIRWEPLPLTEWKDSMEIYTHDFNGHLAGGEGRRAFSLANDQEVGLLVVLRPSAAYSTPAAMDAELKHQMHLAASTYGTAIGGKRGGHGVVSFTADHTDNWYWVSGKEYVIVVAGIDDARGKAFAKALAERTL